MLQNLSLICRSVDDPFVTDILHFKSVMYWDKDFFHIYPKVSCELKGTFNGLSTSSIKPLTKVVGVFFVSSLVDVLNQIMYRLT